MMRRIIPSGIISPTCLPVAPFTGEQILPRNTKVHRWLLVRFVLGVKKPQGFSFVFGVKAFLLVADVVLAVIGAATEIQTETVFHVHLFSMNSLASAC